MHDLRIVFMVFKGKKILGHIYPLRTLSILYIPTQKVLYINTGLGFQDMVITSIKQITVKQK